MLKGHHQQGFTIVELVVVIVLLGILSVTVMPRFFDVSGYRERAAYDEVAGALRYAQKLAVASGCQVRVDVSDDKYKIQLCKKNEDEKCPDGILSFCPDITDFMVLNEESWNSGHPVDEGPEEDVALSSTPSIFIFNAMGRSNSIATIFVGDKKINVIAETGYVHAP